MDQNKDLVRLRKGLGDAFMSVTVAIDQNKRPLARRLPFSLWDQRSNIVVRCVIGLPHVVTERLGERRRLDWTAQTGPKTIPFNQFRHIEHNDSTDPVVL